MDDPSGLRAVANLIESLRKLVSPFTEPVLTEVGAYLADKVRFIRFKNSERVLRRARAILEENNLEPSPVSLKILVPIIEGAALEEDDALVEKWANLLASASYDGRVPPAFPAILAELTPQEGRLLDWLFQSWSRWQSGDDLVAEITCGAAKKYAIDNLAAGCGDFDHVVHNLMRLRIVGVEGIQVEHLGTESFAVYDYQKLVLTPLGWKFVEACRGPSSR